MSVEQLKVDAIGAAQKYKARYKQTLDPDDLDMFQRFMDVYNHLDGLGGGGVSSIVAGNNVTISPVGGTGNVTINANLTGFVPYTGATSTVNLNTQQLLAGHATFATNGSTDTLTINHTSGSGHGIIVTKAGAGEGLHVIKTSGSGNAASITGGITLLSELNLTTKLADLHIASAATWNAKQNAITLTTTGTSGASTFVSSTLNIPNYTLAGLGYSVPTLAQVTTAGNTTTNSITINTLTINNGTFNAAVGFGLINNPTGNFFDVRFENATGLRFGSTSFDGCAFQAFGGLHASFAGQMYFDYGSQQRVIANRSANFRNASNNVPVTVMRMTATSNVLIGTTTDAGFKLDVNGSFRTTSTINATLANVSTANVVYYNTTTGLLTYGAAPSGGGGGSSILVNQGYYDFLLNDITINGISYGGVQRKLEQQGSSLLNFGTPNFDDYQFILKSTYSNVIGAVYTLTINELLSLGGGGGGGGSVVVANQGSYNSVLQDITINGIGYGIQGPSFQYTLSGMPSFLYDQYSFVLTSTNANYLTEFYTYTINDLLQIVGGGGGGGGGGVVFQSQGYIPMYMRPEKLYYDPDTQEYFRSASDPFPMMNASVEFTGFQPPICYDIMTGRNGVPNDLAQYAFNTTPYGWYPLGNGFSIKIINGLIVEHLATADVPQ